MMNVIPKRAITSGTVNDSKYSRITDCGGPVGCFSSCFVSSCFCSSFSSTGINLSILVRAVHHFKRAAWGHHLGRLDRAAAAGGATRVPYSLYKDGAGVRLAFGSHNLIRRSDHFVRLQGLLQK